MYRDDFCFESPNSSPKKEKIFPMVKKHKYRVQGKGGTVCYSSEEADKLREQFANFKKQQNRINFNRQKNYVNSFKKFILSNSSRSIRNFNSFNI